MTTAKLKSDLAALRLALTLARRGYGSTSPNPLVGAVLVKRGKIIGRGWHRRAGRPHAEIEELRDAQKRGHSPSGATLYVTLEPCSTHGRTPPCTDAIIAAGIKRVVIGATDPNPKHAGKSFGILKRAGIAATKVGSSRRDDRTARRAVPTTYVVEANLSKVMEGASRPTHFRGVTTVVAKLFNIVLPDTAVFGAKDWQQATIIKRMVADLNFPVKIIVAPTLRERDGLAMSSRNKYLVGDLRRQAVVLWRAIQKTRAAVKRSKTIPAARLKADLKKFIEREPDVQLDYVEFFEPDTLSPVSKATCGTHMALAVFIGKTRLIDNARL